MNISDSSENRTNKATDENETDLKSNVKKYNHYTSFNNLFLGSICTDEFLKFLKKKRCYCSFYVACFGSVFVCIICMLSVGVSVFL